MKLLCFIIPIVLYFSSFCIADALNCEKRNERSGIILYERYSNIDVQKCWIIEVPDESYARIEVQDIKPYGRACDSEFFQITLASTNEKYKFCSTDRDRQPITALNDVNITYYNLNTRGTGYYWTTPRPYWRTDWYRQSTWVYWTPSWGYRETTPPYKEYFFRLSYKIENLICAQKNSFRCSEDQCVHNYQVCDGVKNCKNGADEKSCETGVAAIKGVNVSREIAITWLKNHRLSSGWGKNTHRAITALFLSKGASFRGKNLEEELMVKELELQTAVALLRNSSIPLSPNDLSMYINALLVTCHNTRQFYGHDLLNILAERLAKWESPSPGAYLTLCNANWTMSESHVTSLLDFLNQSSEYPFDQDIEAMTILALTCLKNKTNVFREVNNANKIYNGTLKKFMDLQKSDGSFGNVYTTALITQALLSSGLENSKAWNVTSAVKHLMLKLNSSSNLLSTTLALPIFRGRTLVDISSASCNISRKQGEDDEISDIIGKLGGKMKIKYSLYLGDQKDVIHSIYLRMPENSSAYDVMRVAQVADPRYKFLHTDAPGYIYVYEIGEITNDPEAGKFWLLYSGNLGVNGTLKHSTGSPDKLILQNEQHLVMWYKTAHVKEDKASKMFRKMFLSSFM